jgi:hypothetical protein
MIFWIAIYISVGLHDAILRYKENKGMIEVGETAETDTTNNHVRAGAHTFCSLEAPIVVRHLTDQ